MSRCSTLRFKIYERDYDKLRAYTEQINTTPSNQARLWVQAEINKLPVQTEERDPNFKLDHLRSVLAHKGFEYHNSFRDPASGWYVARVLGLHLQVFENPDGVFLESTNDLDLIPNYHAFTHILRRRIALIV